MRVSLARKYHPQDAFVGSVCSTLREIILMSFVTKSVSGAVAVLVVVAMQPAIAETTHPWQVFEISLTSSRPLDAPYVDGLPDGKPGYLRATFQCDQGELSGRKYQVTGFWDGKRSWRVRFSFPAAGNWSYQTHSADPQLDGHEATVTCQAWTPEELAAVPTRRGIVQVCQEGTRAGRYFQYADGTPFFWLGDTWWNWTKRDIPFERFKTLVDDRAAKHFTVGQLFFAGSGWGSKASLLDRDYREPDCEQIREIERRIAHANSKGITVWIHGWWSREDMDRSIGAENVRRWTRYLVHRLAAYNVVWVLAGEYNMHDYGGMGLDFWKDLGQMVRDEDPFDRIIGAHPTPPGWSGGDAAPQWSTAEVLHAEPWLSYNQSQPGHGRWRNELIPRIVTDAYGKQPAKPIVVTEPWYEFVEGNPTAADIRFGGWSAILSGAAGHSYGGGHVWRAHVPESPAGRGAWPLEMEFDRNTLDYAGARNLSFMARFMSMVKWWELSPHPELVHENPSNFCAALPDQEYVVFLRWGGVVKLDLRSTTPDRSFNFEWFDLTTEESRGRGTVQGGDLRTFHTPEDYPGVANHKDWILRVTTKELREVPGAEPRS
jgi:hypothetical protein